MSKRYEKPCECGKCKPIPGHRYEPNYGYDLDKVKDVACGHCDQPIGDLPYEEDRIFARFGNMLFRHKVCPTVNPTNKGTKTVKTKTKTKTAVKTQGPGQGSTESHPTGSGNGAGAQVRQPGEFKIVRREQCRPSPTNPRKLFNQAKLEELAGTIARLGIQQPLVVRARPQACTVHAPDLTHNDWLVIDQHGDEESFATENAAVLFAGGEDALKPYFEIVAGERRWRASEIAGLAEVPVVVQELTDTEVLEIQYIENLQREDLTALEEAEGFAKLIGTGSFTADTLAEKLGVSRSHIFGRLALVKLQGPVREALAGGALPASHAPLFATIPTEKMQARALKEVLEGGDYDHDTGKTGVMSFRQAKRHIENKYTLDLEGAPFNRTDENLLEGVGACADCPKRSGNCKEMFPHIKGANVCTDLDCFEKKKGAHIQKARAKAEDKGQTVLPAKETKRMFQYSSEPNLYQTGFVELDDKVPGDPKKRTYEQLLKGDAPAPVVAISPKGKTFEVYREQDLVAAAKAKGIDIAEQAKREQGKSSEERERERKEIEARQKFGDEVLLPEMLAAIQKKTNSLDDMAEFLRVLVMVTLEGHYGYRFREILKRCNLKVEKLELDPLKALLVEGTLRTTSSGIVDYTGDFTDGTVVVCKWLGIDPKAMEKEFRNPSLPGEKFEKAAAKAKTKPAKAAKKGKRK